MKKALSPQQKKTFSYDKDCRNTYSKRGSHFRHAIKAHKDRDRRAFRRQAIEALVIIQNRSLEEVQSSDLKVKTAHRRNWKKFPDEPLKKVLGIKLYYRRAM